MPWRSRPNDVDTSIIPAIPASAPAASMTTRMFLAVDIPARRAASGLAPIIRTS
jgi:hypothetical protein